MNKAAQSIVRHALITALYAMPTENQQDYAI